MAPPVLRVQWDRATARAGHATQKKAGRFASCPKQKLFYVFSSATILWRCKNYVHMSTSTFFSVAPDHQTTPTPPIKVLDRSNKYICYGSPSGIKRHQTTFRPVSLRAALTKTKMKVSLWFWIVYPQMLGTWSILYIDV